MTRTPISANDAGAILTEDRRGAEEEKDSYAEQILKYIPAEVVAFYLPALSTAALLDNGSTVTLEDGSTTTGPVEFGSLWGYVILIIFVVGLIATAVYMYRTAKKDLEEKKVLDAHLRAIIKAGIATFAFFIWALYIGGIFQVLTKDYQIYGTLGILCFTLIAPPLYDYLVGFLAMPPSIIMEYEHSTNYGSSLACTSPFFVTNLSPKETELESIELRWKNLAIYAPESIAPLSESIKSGERKKIEQNLYFRKRGVTHILRIRTKDGHVATSEPFED